MPSSEPPVPIDPGALLAACHRLLRPLARLMIRGGVTLPVLNDMLRTLFVDVAANDILTEPKARSDSRISLVTGIHRKEIRRLRDLRPEQARTPPVVTISSQIIARWLAIEPFADPAGRPRPLPRGNEPGARRPSFDTLVQSVTSDIRSRVVLDDWLSKGIVGTDDADHIVLNVDAFIPKPGADEQLFYFTRNLHDHIAAAAANIAATETAPFLDRSVHYDGLTEEQASELEAFAREEAIRVLLEVNRRAAAMVEGNPASATDGRRVNFGVYVFSEPEDPTGTAPATSGSEVA
jgi:Family of unknown function (DUF6502)